MAKSDSIKRDRTGSSRRKTDVNLPVVYFSDEFKPASQAPEPFDMHELRKHAIQRGFVDGDTDQAEYLLNIISYQHASGYFDLFKDSNGNILEGASLKNLHRVVLFDRKLQAILMEYIGLFELKFRAQYSYLLSMERGPFAHRDPKNFKRKDHFDEFLKRYSDEFNRQAKNRNAEIISAYKKYGDAPTWLAVEIMSFGTLSMLYKNTKSKWVCDGVARSFGVTQDELTSWARSISAVRNQCAHFGQLCGKRPTSIPKKIQGIEGSNENPFYIILILEKLLSTGLFFADDVSLSYELLMLRSVLQLFNDYADVLGICQIPENWFDNVCCETILGVQMFDSPSMRAFGNEGRIHLTVHNGTSGKVVKINM